jgi:hypothetical protein
LKREIFDRLKGKILAPISNDLETRKMREISHNSRTSHKKTVYSLNLYFIKHHHCISAQPSFHSAHYCGILLALLINDWDCPIITNDRSNFHRQIKSKSENRKNNWMNFSIVRVPRS